MTAWCLSIAALVLASLAYTSPQLPQRVSNPGFISCSQYDQNGVQGLLNIASPFHTARIEYTPVVKGNNFVTNPLDDLEIDYIGLSARYVSWTVTGTLYQFVAAPVDNVITIDLVQNFRYGSTKLDASVGYTSSETGPNTRKTFAFSKIILMSPNDTVGLYATGGVSENFVNNITIVGNVLPDQ